jgi:FkbM family methyltransferase
MLKTVKSLARRLAQKLGFALLHDNNDPVLKTLRELHESLRLIPKDGIAWDDSLPQAAALAHLRHLLRLHRIDLVIDVGANRGLFAQQVRRLGFDGEIVSFEPLANLRRELLVAAARDGRWRILPMALGRASEDRDFHVYRDDTFSSFHAINRAGRDRFADLVVETTTERVAVRPLDQLWPELSGGRSHRILLKTDTQGHDLEVMAGAAEVLCLTHAVVAEASFQAIYDHSAGFAELADGLAGRGFVPSGLFPLSHRQTDLALIEVDAFFTKAQP